MNRRQALKTAALAGVATALSRLAPSLRAEAPSPVPAPGNSFKHSVCYWCCRMPLDKLADAAGKIGLHSIELLSLDQIPIVQKRGLTCACAYGPKETRSIDDGFNRRKNHDKFLAGYEDAIARCAKLGIPSIICFSGKRMKDQSDEEGLKVCAEGLRRIMPAAEKAGVTLIMELLNSKVNHKGYLCDRTAWGVELVKRVGSERFKLLYDIYHMQVMEGDVIRTIRENHKHIAHYHTAGNPGRNEFEPQDIQELNYPAIMKAIHDTGFRGYVGQEFNPKRKLLASLENAVKICTVPQP
ncbi:MAG: TIM barrel protein [Puniceicoccales bacterium]|jgi:hydroxypyruvate isomerase|nr:TIM barrel protein [Puniceicoccales bacterium]